MKKNISVIITTKNEEKNLPDLLTSFKKQSDNKFETIVVDNNSVDKTKFIAKKFGTRVFNFGPERSSQRNFGVQKAKSSHVLILDADMKLEKNVIAELLKNNEDMVVIPEKSFGNGFWTKFKVFERSLYEGDVSIEAPRFFSKKLFLKYGGYDKNITGPEDYDLPLRIRKSGVNTGRIKSYILHNEGNFSPIKSAAKKFYYAANSRNYVKKHPEMILMQGNLLFRKAFFKNWKKMIFHPFLTIGMFVVRITEMTGAFFGFVYSVIANPRRSIMS